MIDIKRSFPTIYIIARPNGAGKTTFANTFLPHYSDCREFLNADLIAAGLSPFAPDQQQLLASELMLQRMRDLLQSHATFAFETTLAARSYASRIPEWHAEGFGVCLYFLWLPTVELAIERVATRVRQGGHNIPETTIRQRFQRGLDNFFNLYGPLVDEWTLFDNSGMMPQEIACCDCKSLQVVDDLKWLQFSSLQH